MTPVHVRRALALALAGLAGAAAVALALLAAVSQVGHDEAVGSAVVRMPDGRPETPAAWSGSPIGLVLASLWVAVVAIGLVRTGAPAAPQRASGDSTPLHALFDRLPGVDAEALARLGRLGLATIGQLRALDAAAIAFWGQVDEALVRRWQDLAALLRWGAAPAAGARWLALLGVRSTLHLATMAADELLAAARGGAALPGAPFDLTELAQWRHAAQELHGVPLAPLQVHAEPLGMARRGVLRLPVAS